MVDSESEREREGERESTLGTLSRLVEFSAMASVIVANENT